MLFFRLPVNFLLLMTVVLSSRRFLSPQTGTDRLYKGLSDSIRETSLDSKTIWNWSLFDGCSSYSHSVGRSSSSAQKLWNFPFEFKLKDSLRFSKCRPLKNKPYGTVNSKYIFIWSNVSHTFHLFHYFDHFPKLPWLVCKNLFLMSLRQLFRLRLRSVESARWLMVLAVFQATSLKIRESHRMMFYS